jgi:hypothetical protein
MVSMAGILHLRQTAVHSCGNGLRDSKGGISSSIAFRFVLSQHGDSGLIFEDSADCIEAEIPERGQFSCTVVPLDEWRRAGCGRVLSLPDLPFRIPRNQIVFTRRHRFYIHRSTISGTRSDLLRIKTIRARSAALLAENHVQQHQDSDDRCDSKHCSDYSYFHALRSHSTVVPHLGHAKPLKLPSKRLVWICSGAAQKRPPHFGHFRWYVCSIFDSRIQRLSLPARSTSLVNPSIPAEPRINN